MTWRPFAAAFVLLLAGCSGGNTGGDVPPLPEQTAETGNALMAEAEKASSNAAQRSATSTDAVRSAPETTNEVMP